jgi:hypothetical protein
MPPARTAANIIVIIPIDIIPNDIVRHTAATVTITVITAIATARTTTSPAARR